MTYTTIYWFGPERPLASTQDIPPPAVGSLFYFRDLPSEAHLVPMDVPSPLEVYRVDMGCDVHHGTLPRRAPWVSVRFDVYLRVPAVGVGVAP